MRSPTGGPGFRLACRAYRHLIFLYPPRFRRAFGDELIAAFATLHHRATAARVWLSVIEEAVVDVPLAWVAEAIRRKPTHMPNPRKELIMFADGLMSDFRGAVRGVFRRPATSALVVGGLALGIGATTAVFSVVRGVLLADLPYRDADRLVRIWEFESQSAVPWEVSAGDYLDYRAANETFGQLGAYDPWYRVTYVGDDLPEQLLGEAVSPNLFDILGVQPMIGRPFVSADAETERPASVILSHALWQRRFGGRADVLGSAVTLSDQPYEVIGVMPPGFRTPGLDLPHALRAVVGHDRDFWVPLVIPSALAANRTFHYLQVVGRLHDGETLDRARADLAAIARRAELAYPESNTGHGITATSLRDALVGEVRVPLIIITAAVGFVLLITCANLANVFLSRAVSRRRDIGVRIALGATRAHLIRQHLTEALVLAAAGGVAGVALAQLGIGVLVALDPGDLPRSENISLNGVVLTFTLIVTAATGIISGVGPALFSSRTHPASALSARTGHSNRAARGARHAILVGQITLAVVLLLGASLSLRSFARYASVPLGFDLHSTLTFNVSLPASRYPDTATRTRHFDMLRQRLAAAPAVAGVTIASNIPLAGVPHGSLVVEDHPVPSGEEPPVAFLAVGDDYLSTLGIPLLRGRSLSGRDDATRDLVAVISHSMAERYWPGEDAIGRRFGVGSPPQPWVEVVGVAADYRQGDLAAAPEPMVLFSYAQQGWSRMAVIVRTNGSPRDAIPAVRRAVAHVDNEIPLVDMRSFDEVYGAALARARFATTLMTTFAILALLVAAIGVYGLVAHAVAQRTHEFGVRLALGATPPSVRQLVVAQAILLSVPAVIVGMATGVAAAWTVRGVLYGIPATDPWTLATVPLVLLSMTILASYVPAYRATRVDPVRALSSD